MEIPTFIPIEDAAKQLGVSCERVQEWIRSGTLEARETDGVSVAEDDVTDPEMLVLKSAVMIDIHRIIRRAGIEPFDTNALLREIRDAEYDD